MSVKAADQLNAARFHIRLAVSKPLLMRQRRQCDHWTQRIRENRLHVQTRRPKFVYHGVEIEQNSILLQSNLTLFHSRTNLFMRRMYKHTMSKTALGPMHSAMQLSSELISDPIFLSCILLTQNSITGRQARGPAPHDSITV